MAVDLTIHIKWSNQSPRHWSSTDVWIKGCWRLERMISQIFCQEIVATLVIADAMVAFWHKFGPLRRTDSNKICFYTTSLTVIPPANLLDKEPLKEDMFGAPVLDLFAWEVFLISFLLSFCGALGCENIHLANIFTDKIIAIIMVAWFCQNRFKKYLFHNWKMCLKICSFNLYKQMKWANSIG